MARAGVRRLAGVVTVGVSLLALGACGQGGSSAPSAAPPTAPLPTPVSPAAAAGRGTIVDAQPVTVPDAGAGQVVVYRSTNGSDGAPTEVSGLFFTPSGAPPAGGWPVIVYAHGTTGLTPDCGPTLNIATAGKNAPVQMLTTRGYAVAVVDYQGLGVAGRREGATVAQPKHPYLEPRSAAYDVIDAVRAMRALHPGQISTRWAAAGHSQGGQAAWAAAELAPAYGTGLQLVAAMAQAPALNLTQLGYDNGTITADKAWSLPELVTGLSVSRPEMDRWHYIRGAVRTDLASLIACGAEVGGTPTPTITQEEVQPATAADGRLLQTALEQYSLPQRRISVPVYVAQGTADPVIPPAATTASLRTACAQGDRVHFQALPGKDHNIAGDMSGFAWLYDRFAGKPDGDVCRLG
ncbi:lipase family protein [Tsukamurella soli]|uniref:Lipase family protein n=1 Tax=Tsukamurella soli TaxID=644556 RepID=A0ABP8JN89_9ACTN